MKILSVSQYYPPHIGGLENVAYKQAVTLHASGHTVRVLTCAGERERVGCTHDSGIAVVRVRAWNIFEKKFGIPFPLMGVGLLWHMWREVRRAEVVHVHDVFYMTSWAAYLFARMYRRPIILTQHVAIVEHTSALVMHAQRVVYATFGKLLFRGARTVIVYNENVRNFLLTYGVLPTNIRLIHNGIDTTLYHPPTNATEKQEARQTFGLPKDRPLALFVGRFVPKKGFDVVYGARDPAYDLVFAGSGDFPEEWKHTEGVHFLGAQNQEQLSKLYRAVDLLVSPNLGEVFTLVIQEAMSSGLPVITTDDPGYTSYELDRMGIILCSPTSDTVRQHIARIVSDMRTYAYMSAYSLHLAHEHFDWDKNSSVILDMYAVLEHEQQIQQEVTVRPTPTTGQKKRLMVVAPYFYPKIGGVENYAYNLAHRLHEQGDYDVSVITSNPDVTAKKYVRGELDGMAVHYLPVWKTLSNTPLNLLWFFQIKKIIKEEQPDIINVHSPVPFMADMAMLAAGKTPVVVTYHSGSMIKNQWLIDSIIYVYEKIFLNLLFWRVSAIVAVSYNFIYGPWGKKFAKKTMLIRPGVDTSHFTPTSLPDTKVVAYVGRIEHSSSWKGIEQLLQAMAIVVAHHPDARLEIVGSGDAVEHYKQRAQELGIGHAVTMAGARAGQDLVDAYRRSNVVVLPSTSEAEQSSVVLIEAMASGRPVIGTQIGGTPYIVHDQENGLLVPPRDPEALAQAIERVLTDDTLAQDLAHGALLSAQKVDWRVQIEQYKTLFTSLIQKRTPSRIFNFSFSRISIVAFIVAWWSIVVLLSLKDSDPLGLLNILGFSFLLFVPGFLTLSIVGLRNLEPWVRVSMMIAISILELILAALVANTLLPLAGIERPLSKTPLIIAISFLTTALCFLFWKRATAYSITIRRAFFSNKVDALAACLPLGLVILSVAGALRLNNGSGNSLTVLMLILTGMYVGWLTWLLHHKKVRDAMTVPFALWCISLALLLMTSLRGWYISGHDVQVEFRVFELTKDNGRWLIEAYRDAYNACMSITVLPTIFASLLKLSDPYVYKVLFQIMFAVVPGVIYTFTRKYVASVIALLASFYFIAFPTFFGDMPMLNRQEIAFLFWTLMIYILFEEQVTLRLRQFLFVALGLGMILSHYSTTYTVIALLSFLVIARLVFRRLTQWPWFATYGSKSAVELPDATKKPYVTLWMVGALIAGSFLWSSVLTDTSSGSIYRVISKTFETIRQNSKEDTRSSDVLYSIFSWGTSDPEKSLELYKEKTADPIRERAPSGTYYDTATYDKYDIHAVSDDQPLTGLGQLIASSGVKVSKTNDMIRQMLAKVLQILIIIGFLSVVIRRRFFEKKLDTEFFLLAVGNVLMVASQVILPVLSAEYGVLRAFEQSLMFLGILVVVGGLSLCVKLSEYKRVLIVTGFAIIFFYAMTGVFAQLFVRNPGQLHLSNAGMYYDAYYTHDSELQAVNWLDTNAPKIPDIKIQTDHTAVNTLYSIKGAEIIHGIYPALIRRDSYVLLTYANVHKSQSMVLWNSNIIKYVYPTVFLDEQKDLLYNNGDVKIYR